MNAKRFRKIFLPSVILLFSVLVLGQAAWACDTPERECYVQLDIKSVHVDGNSMHILGRNFTNGGSPEVAFGGVSFPVDSYTNEEIVAIFPAVFEPGHYKLEVSTGDGYKCKDKQSVTLHHREEPPPPPPPTCPPVTCTCPTATLDTKIVSVDGTAFEPGSTPGSTLNTLTGTASCTSLGPGYRVTGGGFSVPQGGVTLMESKPFVETVQNGTEMTGTGWQLVLTVASDVGSDLPLIKVWAVCAKIVQQSP